MQKIILYYKFTPVKDAEAVRRWQTALCAQLGLHGRIIVSPHGINGTLGGDVEALENYIEAMEHHHQEIWGGLKSELTLRDELAASDYRTDFSGIEYKWSDGGVADFPKLSVKYRAELVTLNPDQEFNPYNNVVGV